MKILVKPLASDLVTIAGFSIQYIQGYRKFIPVAIYQLPYLFLYKQIEEKSLATAKTSI